MERATRLVTGTLLGTVTLSTTGYLIFGIAFPNLYRLHESRVSNRRRPTILPTLAVALGMLAYAALITFVIAPCLARQK